MSSGVSGKTLQERLSEAQISQQRTIRAEDARAHLSHHPLAVLRQRNVGDAGVSAVQTPLGLAWSQLTNLGEGKADHDE